MKNITLLLVLLTVASVPAFAQTTSGGWGVGFGGDVGIPVGDLSNGAQVGFGGNGWVGYMVDQNLTVTGKAGVISFSAKTGYTPSSVTVVPILVGARYFFMPPADMRVYGHAEAGVFNISNGGGTKFGFAPTLGAQFKAGDNMNVDVHANYTYVSTDFTSSSWVGVGIGLEFGLK